MIIFPYTKDLIKKVDQYLSKKEKTYFVSLEKKHPEKKLTWLAGRIAAKKAIRIYAKNPNLRYSEIEIKKNKFGRPYFKNINFSISHTKKFAAAGVGNCPIGIDIETIRKFPAIVYDNFLTPAEKKWIEQLPKKQKNTYVTIFWSIKEAYVKAIGTGLRIHPQKIEIRPNNKGVLTIHRNGVKSTVIPWYNVSIPNKYVTARVVFKNK